MKKHTADQYPGFAPPRRRFWGTLLTAISLAVGLTCIVLFVGAAVLATVVNGALAAASGVVANIIFWAMIWPIALFLALPVAVIELLWLLQTGQAVQFVIRLLQTLTN